MTEQTPTPETEQPVEEAPETVEETTDDVEGDDALDSKGRRALRRANEEAKKYRLTVKEQGYELDRLRADLFEARAALAGVLIDPADLPFDPDIVDDPAAIAQAARDLVAERPYLGRNRTTINVGQHEAGSDAPPFDLATAIRNAVTG